MGRNAKKLRNLKRDLAGIAKSKHDEEVLALKRKEGQTDNITWIH